MKLACQENLVPGATLREKVLKLEAWGFDGVELWGQDLASRVEEVKAAITGTRIKVSSVCAGYPGALLSAQKDDRQKAFDGIVERVTVAGQLGATGVIVVPIFGGPQVNDLSPWKNAREVEDALLAEYVARLSERLADAGADVILEPLNRYETHYMNRLEQAYAFCEQVEGKATSFIADFFHMGIEEADPVASIQKNIRHLSHVHLADSNRMLPGQGHRDFKPLLQALKDGGFTGYMAIESGVLGDREVELEKSCAFLRKTIAELN